MRSKRPRARRKTAISKYFPTFQNSHLRSFGVCSCFPLSDSSLSRFVRDLGTKLERRKPRFESSAGPAWIRVRIELLEPLHRKKDSRSPAEYDGHFHTDCFLEAES